MESPRKPPNRINERGEREAAPTWESLVDRQIREAMDEGKFDDLPFQGEPLPAVDDAFAGEWAMAFRMLKNAGAAPPWIIADKEVRALLDRREAILARARRPRRSPGDATARSWSASSWRSTRPSPASTPRRPRIASTGARWSSQRSWRGSTPRRTAGTDREPTSRPTPPPQIHVRRATPSHAPAIRAIADAAWRATYRDLLRAETIERFLERAYSEDRVGLRIERHETWVAELGGVVSAFAESESPGPDHPRGDLRGPGAARPGPGHGAAATRSRTPIPGYRSRRTSWWGTPRRDFYAARGFVPGEDIDEELGGEHVRERRWWLRPGS